MSRWRSVTAGEIVVPVRSTTSTIGRSRPRRPWPISCNTATAVNSFVMDAVSNRVAKETGAAHRRVAQPYAPENTVASPRRISTTPENRSPAARDRSHPSNPANATTTAQPPPADRKLHQNGSRRARAERVEVDAEADDLRGDMDTPELRSGRHEEICTALIFLASDAGSYVTGITLPVKGGMLAT